MPGTTKEIIGIGSREATRAGIGPDQPAPERQRASMTAKARLAGTPATPGTGGTPGTPGTPATPATPGTPGTPGGGGGVGPPTQITPPVTISGSVPNPLAAGRQAWGWDTNVGVSVGLGEEASAAVYGGITTGYAFPLGDPISMGAFTMKLIRIGVGLYKLVNDVLTGSPMGFIRDAVALGVFGIEEVVGTSVTTAIIDWAVPLPAGAAG
jgi:hypothetical protein